MRGCVTIADFINGQNGLRENNDGRKLLGRRCRWWFCFDLKCQKTSGTCADTGWGFNRRRNQALLLSCRSFQKVALRRKRRNCQGLGFLWI